MALVHTKVKGSTLAPRVRWAVAWGMYREQIVWRCPYTHSTFRSKSYSVTKLNHNMNYGHFFGKPMISTRKQCAIPSDRNDKIDVYLDEVRPVTAQVKIPVTGIKTISDSADGAQKAAIKKIKVTPNHELGGSVRVYDSNGQQLEVDSKTGELMIPQPDRQTELHTTEQPSTTEGKPDDRQDRPGDSRLLRLTQDSGVTRQREEHLEPLMSGTESYKTDSQRIDMTDNNDTVAHSRQLTAGNQLENKTDDKLLAELFEDSDHTDQSYLDSQEYNQLPEDSSDDETDQEALDHIAEIFWRTRLSHSR